MKTMTWMRRGLWALGALACMAHAWAQPTDWPSRNIRLIVPYAAGGPADLVARELALTLTNDLKQSVTVENMGGAMGVPALGTVARAEPDGHTLLLAAVGNVVLQPMLSKRGGADLVAKLKPVGPVSTAPHVLAVSSKLPVNNVAQLVAYAKAHPGQLSLATNGEGGYPHLTFEDLRLKAGFTYLHVPYKGSVQVTNDVLSGQVQAGILGMAPFTPHIRAGKMRLIAISSPEKVSDWPDAPLAQDTVPGFSALGWFGYVAPAGTPPDIVEKLNKAINAAIAQPAVTEKLQNMGLMVVRESPQYFEKILRSDYERYGQIVKAIGYQPQ